MARTVTMPFAGRERRLSVLLILAAMTAALVQVQGLDAPEAEAAPTPNGYTLVEDVSTATFDRMVDFALIPGTTDEAVLVSQHEARLRRVSLTGAFAPDDYGDLSDRVFIDGWENGLLSLAFSPNFVSDGRIYVYYTSLTCTPPVTRCVHISRFQVVNDMLTGPGGETVIWEIDQVLNAGNHNGGRILFGPDGYLYSSIGDGGFGGDPSETGQNHTDLLGSVFRINVTGQVTYTVPADNPFVGVEGDDRVWAYGLRNPWRYSFDRLSGDLWLGDVGQNAWEEVEEIVAGGNYGWDCYEGNVLYPDFEGGNCSTPPTPFLFPRAAYDHSWGCSVTGGYVYRGALLPELYGWYVYGDHCSGVIWAVNPADASDPVLLADTDFNIGSFAELPNGELLVLRMFQPTDTAGIYRLTCATAPDTDGDGQGNACDLDDDGDEFSDAIESYVGTNQLNACGTDAWPADINNDTFSDITDVSFLTGNLGAAVPPAPARHNIAPDPPDGFVDITDVSRMTGLFGTGCGP